MGMLSWDIDKLFGPYSRLLHDAKLHPMRVTLDTSAVEPEVLQRAQDLNAAVQVVTVTVREVEGTSFSVVVAPLPSVAEAAVWDESRWGEAAFFDPAAGVDLEEILTIIADGGFPKEKERDALSPGQRSQLRDAMIFEAHARSGADCFVTDDLKAFIKWGRREQFEERFESRILTVVEFLKLTAWPRHPA